MATASLPSTRPTTVAHCDGDFTDSDIYAYVGRTNKWRAVSKWGNPFRIGADGNRIEVVAKHRVWLLTQPQLLADLVELKGKILGCWCEWPLSCHGRTLAEFADVVLILPLAERLKAPPGFQVEHQGKVIVLPGYDSLARRLAA
jgi:hypothetical protein